VHEIVAVLGARLFQKIGSVETAAWADAERPACLV
jgi:hypothetical protein